MVGAVACWTLAKEARLQCQANSCEFRGRQSGTGTVSPSASVFPYKNHFTNAFCVSSSKGCLYQKDRRMKPGNLKKSNVLLEVGGH
jgi:hypothetical protein